jgi:hypothetical protein
VMVGKAKRRHGPQCSAMRRAHKLLAAGAFAGGACDSDAAASHLTQ